jgi:deoxyhypusine synthase
LTENLKLSREAVEYIGSIVIPEDDYKLVETLIKNQNVIRS